MTRATGAKLKRKGVLKEEDKYLTEQELVELRELQRIAASEMLKANVIRGNTALVPNGQEVATQFEAVARVMSNYRDQFMASAFTRHGYKNGEPLSIDLKTGKITRA